MIPKVIAMYLPQFHRIAENDEWWGEGFTEWTNVKKAKPLFEGHYQPRIPFKNDYYDLSQKTKLPEQMGCASEYGVDCFCFYHYWFGGKKLLEKPVEALIENNNLPIDFCLCWANEPWTRTWDGELGAKEILIDQNYGEEPDWEAHFNYLLQFFDHKNYLKKNGKPVMVIYKGVKIKKRTEMISCWDNLARQHGFGGIYIVNAHRDNVIDEIPLDRDAVFDFEPFATLKRLHNVKVEEISKFVSGIREDNSDITYRLIDYERFCNLMVNRYPGNQCHYLGFFVGWDNSPRLGKGSKIFFYNNEPDMVKYFFKVQYEKSIHLGKEFVFINAWNEWCEGAYLEPDEKYGYAYLEAIKQVVKGGDRL